MPAVFCTADLLMLFLLLPWKYHFSFNYGKLTSSSKRLKVPLSLAVKKILTWVFSRERNK